MNCTLRRIRADWLARLADGETLEVGVAGHRDRYPQHLAQSVGPMISALHRQGLIEHAGATYAARPTRHRAIARLWRAIDPNACAALAAADQQWLAEHPAESSASEPSKHQLEFAF